ncbi:MAG: hypothetical protein JWN46_1006 [Acidimicrobiales bacterium]|nr:hypothetical protein [Acidimicrobiales bacterium]
MQQPGALLAAGRDADIFEYGPGRVLRRSRDGRSLVEEARTMEHARAHGYPVPAVESTSDDGTGLVMERIDGVSMVDALAKRPWTLARQGRDLAGLLVRLHEISAPDWLRSAPVGAGDRLLHLDLHPLNVMVTARGPVVIDWANAARGDPAVDVALSWVLTACGGIPVGRVQSAILGYGRSLLVRRFVGVIDAEPARRQLAEVVAWKVQDPHMSGPERAAMHALVKAEGRGTAAERPNTTPPRS